VVPKVVGSIPIARPIIYYFYAIAYFDFSCYNYFMNHIRFAISPEGNILSQTTVSEETSPDANQNIQITPDTTQQISQETTTTIELAKPQQIPSPPEPAAPTTTTLETPVTTTTLISPVTEPSAAIQTQESQPASQPNLAETGYSIEAPLYLAGTVALAGLAILTRKHFYPIKKH
jgi:hypothetical protein